MSPASFVLNPKLEDIAPLALFGLLDPVGYKVSRRFNPTEGLKKVCLNPEANPLSVRTVLDDATNREWHDWEPEMVREFCGIPETETRLSDKVMAVQVAITNPDVFSDWDLFVHCCVAFNHRRCSFDWLDKPDLLELAWACTCLRGLNGTQQFGPGVERFIIACMISEGLTYFPWTGGDGVHLCQDPYAGMTKGLVEPALCAVADDLKKRWDAGELQELDPSPVNDKNTFETQLGMIINCQAYIRGQHKADPNSYI